MARPEVVGTTIPFCQTLAEIQALPTSVPVAFCLETGKECLYYYTGTTWKRVAGRICTVDNASPLDMSNGVLTVDLSGYATLTDISDLASKADTAYVDNAIATIVDEIGIETEATTASLELKADTTVTDDLQQKYDELSDNFLRLLRWTLTTFDQVPEGLEGQIEAALGVE